MKKSIILIVAFLTMLTANSQTLIQLPAPQTSGGLPTNEALALRRSVREFDKNHTLDIQIVSNMLWATCGVNRPESQRRTNPTALNWQEIDAYYFDTTGVYRYDAFANTLVKVVDGDHRELLAGKEFKQEFVLDAPASVLLVGDTSKAGDGQRFVYIDGGIANQNLNLFCAANGLVTVPRGTMDHEGLKALLNLPESTILILNNPVGYPVN